MRLTIRKKMFLCAFLPISILGIIIVILSVTSLKTFNLTSCGETIFKGYFFGGVGSQENRALTTLECTGVQSYSLNLSLYPNLSKESLLNVINCLCTTTETLQLALGSTNLSKLSADEIKIATDKGWSVIA